MKRRYAVCALSAVLGLFVGCATLNEGQCRSGSWSEIGRTDGLGGHSMDRFTKHSEACGEYGVAPDRAGYEKGRLEGLTMYCAPDNGFRMGKSGSRYQSVCPAHLETAFLKKYNAGKEVGDLERKIKSTYDEINRVENQLDQEKDDGRRRNLREKVRDLGRQKDDLQRRLTVLEVREGA